MANRNWNTDEGTNQPTGYYHQGSAMNWTAGVVGSGLTLAIDAAGRVRHTQKKQTTGYYDEAPAMNRSAGVGGSGLALAIALGPGYPSEIETQTK